MHASIGLCLKSQTRTRDHWSSRCDLSVSARLQGLQFFPAQALRHILDRGHLPTQVLFGPLSAFPVQLPVDRRPGQDPVATGTKNTVNLDQVEATWNGIVIYLIFG
ncbi:hypothetical protein SELMODRAFT_439524, partial [Selaginella moellendorffii]